MTWPTEPSTNDTVTINGVKFTYDGDVWNRDGFVFDTLAADSYTVANLNVTNKSQLGAAGNVFIGGGSPGLFLTNNGTGGLAWSPPVSSQGISNGTSNVYVYNDSNVALSISGVSNTAVFTATGANLIGYANITGSLNASTVTTGLITSNVSTGSAPFIVASTTRVANLNAAHANLSDYGVVTRQTSGLYYPTLASGNATGNYALGVSANMSFDISNSTLHSKHITITNNANVDNLVAISDVTTSNLSASGTANLIGASILLGANANVKLTGGTTGQYLQTDGTGNLSWATVTLPIINNGTSNVSVAPSGNIVVTAAGNSILTVTGTGANINGYANVNGDLSAGNISVTGNVNASIITSTISSGAPLKVTSTTRVDNLNVARANVSDYTSVTNTNSGNIYIAFASAGATGNYALQSNTAIYANVSGGNLHATNFVGNFIGTVTGSISTAATVTASAQPNITSVGTLVNLTSSGVINFTSASNVSLGSNANLKINGGTSGQYLQTNGSGALTWSTVNTNFVFNGTSNISIPSSGGNINNYVGSNLTLIVTGTGANVTGYANISGNITTTGNIDVIGSVNASVLTSNVTTGTSPLNVTSTTRVANLNVSRANVSDYTLVTTTSTGNMNFTFANANNTSNYSLYSNTALYANLSSGAMYAANFIGGGSQLTGVIATSATSATTAGTVTTAAQPNITSTGSLTSLTVTGTANFTGVAVFAPTQDVTVTGTPSGTVTYDTSTGVVFDVVPTANWTANLTNMPTTNNRATVITFIITQGATPYLPTVLQIAGVTQTVKWIGGLSPSGTASKVDVIAYSIIRSSAGAWVVLGSLSTYG